MKYVLSTGVTTTRTEDYVKDLIKIYLTVFPGDIPGRPNLGVDFNLVGVLTKDLQREVYYRVNTLVEKINDLFKNTKVKAVLKSIDLIDLSRAKVIILVNQEEIDDIVINLYDKEN